MPLLYVGTSGWLFGSSDRHVYENKKTHGGIIKQYSKQLNSVECNSSYYRNPKPADAKRWAIDTPPNFRFVLKAHRSVVNSSDPRKIKRNWRLFWAGAKALGRKLAGVIFEFRGGIRYNEKNMERFAVMAKLVPKGIMKVIELRHSSWYTDEPLGELRKLGFTVAVIHVNNRGGWAGDLKTGFWPPLSAIPRSSNLYFRLHGTKGKYVGAYTKKIISRLKAIIKRRVSRRGFIYFNNVGSMSRNRMPDGYNNALGVSR